MNFSFGYEIKFPETFAICFTYNPLFFYPAELLYLHELDSYETPLPNPFTIVVWSYISIVLQYFFIFWGLFNSHILYRNPPQTGLLLKRCLYHDYFLIQNQKELFCVLCQYFSFKYDKICCLHIHNMRRVTRVID